MIKKLQFLIFTIIMFIPFCVKAYGIDNYYIDATIEEDGDILVQEYFSLTGSFNGFERVIEYSNDNAYQFDPNMDSFGGSDIHNGSGLEIIEVRAVSKNSNFDFTNIDGNLFNKTSSASKGDFGVYEENVTSNGKNILIYNPSSYDKAFYIKYRINNMAIKHNDVGEIGWNLIGDEFKESIGNFKAYIHVPGNTNIRAWAHGPLNGQVTIIDNENVLVSISGLSSYRAIDVRLTFDLGVISKSDKTTNVNALDKILLYEQDKAQQANYERKNQEKQRQQRALEYLNKFEVNITRYNYNYAIDYISDVTDIGVRTHYMNRLKELKVLLDEKEVQEAKDALNHVQKYPDYVWYEDAKEKIDILDNEDVKKSFYEELLIVEELIKEEELKKEIINYIFGFILLIIIIVSEIIVYKKYRKDPITEFKYDYFRDVPSNYSPETVSYLFHKKITNNALSAAILELVRKKVILVEKISSKNYKLTMNSDYKEELTTTESRLARLVLQGRHSIETKEMKKNARKNYDSFIGKWNSYHSSALSDGKRYSFYESDEKKKKKDSSNSTVTFVIIWMLFAFSFVFNPLFIVLIGYLLYKFIKFLCKFISSETNMISNFKESDKKVLFLLIFLICFFVALVKFIYILFSQHFYTGSSSIYLMISILSLGFIPMIYNKRKRTINGAEEYKKWSAFKNFLNDFGKFTDKEVMEVTLWEKYLVFATLFGCAKKVAEVMKVEMVNNPNDYIDTYLDLTIMNSYITSSIRSSYSAAQGAYSAAHSSSGGSSSGGGGGGGFSSGGGSFGGGGGGGRF